MASNPVPKLRSGQVGRSSLTLADTVLCFCFVPKSLGWYIPTTPIFRVSLHTPAAKPKSKASETPCR
jgi:hypothetical protein